MHKLTAISTSKSFWNRFPEPLDHGAFKCLLLDIGVPTPRVPWTLINVFSRKVLVSKCVDSLQITRFISGLIKRQEYPMLIAVSWRSPVRTQTLIPASIIVWIVSGTPSCNLSSIAVAPMRVKSLSISSAALSSSACLLLICLAA